MGIDLIAGGRIKRRNFREASTPNAYLRLLIKLYSFLARRTDSKFNKTILKRLNQSRVTRYPISISRITKLLSTPNNQGKIAVVVANVLNDERLLTVPKLTVAALRFTEQARARILASGGTCLTFDQLAQKAPNGENTVLLRGPRRRVALKYFGPAPGSRHSTTRPRTLGPKKSRTRNINRK
eukprot:TRINITY_DN744_c0_g1_i2.p2 TRINITY_DN744_c0_g1~~TRINITY_DN744_c0_g1_i2.p2  ORF type:complete len:182 (-),score=60.03 TRINITY_DN744_c0_g1_i2:194-739(-)